MVHALCRRYHLGLRESRRTAREGGAMEGSAGGLRTESEQTENGVPGVQRGTGRRPVHAETQAAEGGRLQISRLLRRKGRRSRERD
ncbi:hypothetical protein Pmani_006712 [Petrolisthes manimaculis]|uniref:Uncharacterized protein n=1 Tax=Petrolisthes manimaculis TaxID=1843537 RepID=A0AAE1Q9S6_9EUCA|nr:hypothetical protein Pmani_006712 [Petrolisthes manimaculis]